MKNFALCLFLLHMYITMHDSKILKFNEAASQTSELHNVTYTLIL